MKKFAEILGIISLVSLHLGLIGAIIYYAIEFVSSFFISTINLVEIGNVFWKIIFICFGSAVCTFALAHVINKNYK